jgi:acyl-coenzyme A synthetase/AMP-(fatty) acid ligase
MNIWRKRIEDWRTSKNATAVRSHDEQLTWQEVADISDELIAKLRNLGQGARPTVILAVRGPVGCALVAALLGSDACGMVLERNSVNATLSGVLEYTEADAIVIKASDLEMFKSIASGFSEQDLDSAPGYLLLMKSDRKHEHAPHGDSKAKWLIQTSGTTRSPKIVMIAADDLVARAQGEIRDFDLLPEDEVLNALTLSHDVGFNQILSWVMTGFTLRVFSKLSSAELLKTLDRDGITGISGTPLQWIGLLREIPIVAKSADRNRTLKYLTVSGGSLEVEAIDRIRSYFERAVVIKTYGQTETFRSLISKTLPGEKLSASLGLPLQGVTLELIDDTGSTVRGPGHGQLVHNGPGTMMGYLNKRTAPDDSKQKSYLTSGILTGDYFDRDEAGMYYYKGRRDDLIKRFELRLFLSETEEAIRELPYIELAIVLSRAVKDARQNEMVAFVTLKPGLAQDVREATLQHCKTCLAPHKVPDDIFVLQNMPQTESLKVDRKQLLSYWENAVVKPSN